MAQTFAVALTVKSGEGLKRCRIPAAEPKPATPLMRRPQGTSLNHSGESQAEAPSLKFDAPLPGIQAKAVRRNRTPLRPHARTPARPHLAIYRARSRFTSSLMMRRYHRRIERDRLRPAHPHHTLCTCCFIGLGEGRASCSRCMQFGAPPPRTGCVGPYNVCNLPTCPRCAGRGRALGCASRGDAGQARQI